MVRRATSLRCYFIQKQLFVIPKSTSVSREWVIKYGSTELKAQCKLKTFMQNNKADVILKNKSENFQSTCPHQLLAT